MADIQLAADNTSVDSYLGHVVPDVLKTVQGLPTEVYGVSLGDLVWNDMSLFPSTVRGWRRLASRPSACRATTITIRPS